MSDYDSVSGEIIRSLCDEFEGMLQTHKNFTDSVGTPYQPGPEEILEGLIEHLRNEAPEPEAEAEAEEEDEEEILPISKSLNYLRERVKNDPKFADKLEAAIEEVTQHTKDNKWQERLGRESEALIQKANNEYIEEQRKARFGQDIDAALKDEGDSHK